MRSIPALQNAGIVRRPHRRRDPHAALLVEHRIVDVVAAGPDRLRCPSTATAAACRGDVRGVFGSRTVSCTRLVVWCTGSSTGQVVGAELERPVDQTVGVHRRVAAVGRHLVVQVRLRIGPVPLRDDDVALDALRPRRRRRQLRRRRCDRSSRRTCVSARPSRAG